MADVASIEKQTRDAVSAELAREGTKAIVIIGQHLAMAARAESGAHEAVAAAVRGGLGAVFLASHEKLADESIKLLQSLPNLSLMSRVGPEEIMTWVMEGVAAASSLAGPDTQLDIRNRIDEEFHGAGEIFAAICEKARPQ